MGTSRKNILFLCSWFPNRKKALEGNFILKHAQCLQEIANVYVLFAKASEQNNKKFEIEKSTDEGISITKVYFRKSKLPVFASFINLLRYIKALKVGYTHIPQIIDKVNVNVAFPAGLYALFLKRKGLSYDITEHWSGYLNETKLYEKESFIVKKLHQQIFRESSQVFAVSDYLGKSLTYYGLADSYELLPNFIDENLFKPREKNESFTFIHISTLDEQTKNFSGILRALEKLKIYGCDFKFVLIGEADAKEVMLKLERHNLLEETEAHFYIKSQEVAEKLSRANCLIQFSNFETFSIVLAEAWLSGVKTVHSKCGGLTENDNSTLGVQIPKGDENALFQALLKAFTMNDEGDFNTRRELALSMFHKTRITNAYMSNNY